MKTRAVRLYGVNDLRTEEFELPEIQDCEILARVISDSICMSSHKAALQGAAHKRVPDDVAENPIILGHEFCGEIIEVGEKWKDQFKEGDKFSIQPAINYKGSLAAPGYSYHNIGGGATYVIIPNEVMELGCLLPYKGEAFYLGSLSEAMSCIVGGFHANYHTTPGSYEHKMGTVEGGAMAILAGAGPMGLGAVDYAIHGGRPPRLLVVTDIDNARLERAASLITVEDAAAHGVELKYINTALEGNTTEYLKSLTGKDGYDDVFVYAPVRPVVEQADALLGRDGCLNFFAGPTNPEFSAMFNFYNVHYASTHIVGTSGGNTDDMRESLKLMEEGKISPSCMITHIGGLNADAETTLNLPGIPGGKKLIYTHIDLPLTAIADFRAKAEEGGENAELFRDLADICEKNNGLWCPAAEKRILRDIKF
ncbi:MAG: L-sorbose 1-phosphate reductase [Ruminococcaceae bacterium]|nr:L-sorbose 1-phosphate reductase [Oscillospiraceae bacterium]